MVSYSEFLNKTPLLRRFLEGSTGGGESQVPVTLFSLCVDLYPEYTQRSTIFVSGAEAYIIVIENPSKLKALQYIGAEGRNVTFSDVPINPDVDFNFIVSFAIDYSNSSPPSLTYGDFHFFRQGPPSKRQGGEESWQ
ncbi:hypothetical protein RHGRI_002402 [Rhododendron griersonianum]|uniref:Uncharacterized protein n=1 Tax=Rhododendron griersonianum TaxID=479676 RepID=A0AAV6LNU7_9ERIC|nr:hypothetical protein RHGRI_002402 [Rhododendron griersonianum]